MAQDTTPSIIVYQGDGTNHPFSIPFDKGYYGEVKVLFVRRGLADYTYEPTTYEVNGRLYAWSFGSDFVYTHTANPAVGAKTYDYRDVEQSATVSAIAGQTITVDGVIYNRSIQSDIANNLLLTWTGDVLQVGDFIAIIRDTERGQPYEYPNNQKHIERALDNLERQIQEVKDATDNALKVDPAHTIDPSKMSPIDWMNTILRSVDLSVRALRFTNGWVDYSLDDPNIANIDKTWYHLLNTENIKNIRESSRIESGKTIYWTEYQASDGSWKTLCDPVAWDQKIDEAKETANQAYSKAETAEGVADSAYEKSEEAERVVNTFDGRLTQAESDASDAKTIAESTQSVVDSHITNKSNPHEVTKTQVGLGNVDNTSDLDKPISTATQAALNAQQEEIDALSGRGRFLSLWNCATGLAESNPPESPYPYKAGDYFVVGTVSSADPSVNYKPDGSSYTTGVASTTVETNEVSVNDTYFYDGTVWKLQSNAQKEVSFSALAGSPYDNTALGNALDSKQNTLTAGTNISIVNNVISSTAQESFFRGKWNTWSNVPTDANLYPSDYKGSHIPTESDYMVVEDASGFVPGLDIELFIPQTGTRAFTLGGEQKTVPDYPNEVSWVLPDITITASFHNGINSWFTANKTVKCNNIIYAPGETFAKIPYYGNPGPTIYYSNSDSLSGAWRFSYRGTWATDNVSGWKPEYQVEDVLPIATDSIAGIAKLYTTTGNNTDGAIDQNGTTTAINTAVSTHNTASNAHSNIRGTANGLATLDANAKVPLTQMNDALVGNVSYQGLWNAATNDPLLQDPTGGLPSDYQALGYIDLNGGYIDTLISFDSSTDEIQYDFNLEIVAPSATIANRRIFGAASGDNGYDLANSAGSLYNRHNWESGYFASAGSNQSILNNVSRLDSNTFKMVLNRTNNAMAVYVNSSLNANINVTQGAYTTNTIYVGTCHLDSGAATNICPDQRYQYFKITKDGVLAGDFRPAKRLADGVIGFFDVVSNTFFTNLGSGTFTGGGAIEIPKGHYYITSTAGTQFGIHFEVGDWIISTGTSWSKVNNTDAVSSVEGRTGNVTVINDNASTGATTYTWSADKLTTEFGSLGTAAYTATTDYATAAQGAKADTALQPADVVEYTANEVETLWNSI